MTLLYLNSDRMGDGDPDLGRRLLQSFLHQLATAGHRIDFIACVSEAVNLTTKDSPVLGSLNALQTGGAAIAPCGTCLDHHGMRHELAIGEVGSMDVTVELLATADRVILPC